MCLENHFRYKFFKHDKINNKLKDAVFVQHLEVNTWTTEIKLKSSMKETNKNTSKTCQYFTYTFVHHYHSIKGYFYCVTGVVAIQF